MGIKCSLFGHAFGESTVEREREEQGSEVVSTIREIEKCDRCGETRIVSENTEVTTLETPDDVEPEPSAGQQSTTTTDASSAIVDAEQPKNGESETGPAVDSGQEATDAVAEAAPQATDDAVDQPAEDADEPPVTDDAEILEDDDEPEVEREPGEWPQEADESAEETAYEDEDFDQFGYTDEETETADDAEFIDDDDAAVVDDADEESDGEDAEFVDEEPTSQAAQTNEWPSEDEIDAAGEPESAGPGAVTVPEGRFHCEGCGFSTPVESSSLRAGDFCPECHQETLVQVRDGE